MESVITIEFIVTAIGATALAAVLGYLGQKWMGAAILGSGAALASGLCIAGAAVGYHLGDSTGAWIGLLVGVVVGGVLGSFLLGRFIKGHGSRFIAGLWLGFCALCAYGYLAGGWIGLLLITLPSIIVFWYSLYRVAAYILPLHDKRNKEQQAQAFRSLITFTMGTNYPYYFVQGREVGERVPGNPYMQFFAGPGIVYTRCDHVAYNTDGIRAKGVFEPGLSFTGLFDLKPKALDLRPQFRAFPVDATTRDGILVRVLTFMPFRVYAGRKNVELGHPFPFRRKAVFDIVAGELTERNRQRDTSGEKHEWDGSLVPLLVTPIVQDVIGQYTVDQLCCPLGPDQDPRSQIAAEINRRSRRVLAPRGIELIDGWLSNLEPQDTSVQERRIDNWKTEWENRILSLMSKSRAERARQMEQARAEAELRIVARFSQVIEASGATEAVTQTALALRFIDCLGEMVSEYEGQWPLPSSFRNTLDGLRGELTAGQR